jgi:hypothetical protein
MRLYTNENGIVWMPIIIALVAVAVILGGLYLVFGNQKQVVSVQSGKCSCDDIPDLKNRLNEVNAAIAEYQLAIQDVQSHDTGTGSTTMYNEGTFKEEQANVQNAINGAHTRGTKSGSGDTGTDCGTKVTAGSACLQGSFQSHENVHATTCQRTKGELSSKGTGSWTTNYKDSMTMVAYWNDEIAGYQAEIPYLNNELNHATSAPGCLQYECKKGSGVLYDTAVDCTNNCVRKIASLDNWCWEYSPGSGTYTGKKY